MPAAHKLTAAKAAGKRPIVSVYVPTACGSISESETVIITPPAKPSEKAIVRWRGRRTKNTTSPPSPVESPASVVSVRANNIIPNPFSNPGVLSHLYAAMRTILHQKRAGIARDQKVRSNTREDKTEGTEQGKKNRSAKQGTNAGKQKQESETGNKHRQTKTGRGQRRLPPSAAYFLNHKIEPENQKQGKYPLPPCQLPELFHAGGVVGDGVLVIF